MDLFNQIASQAADFLAGFSRIACTLPPSAGLSGSVGERGRVWLRARFVRALAVAMALVSVAVSPQPTAWARPVTLRGRGQLQLNVARHGDELAAAGTLTEDTGSPISGATVEVVLTNRTTGAPPVVATASTDAEGHWFAQSAAPIAEYDVLARYGGSAHLEGCQASTRTDLARGSVWLTFTDPIPTLHLDDETLVVRGQATDAASRIGVGGVVAQGTPIRLSDERDRALAEAQPNAQGALEFRVKAADLTPGEGELRMEFAGTPTMNGTRQVRHVMRVARVRLRATAPVAAENPESGLALDVVATWAHGTARSGTLEAYAGDLLVGAVGLGPGTPAPLTLKFGAPAEATSVDVRVHFRPADPFFESGTDAVVPVAIRGPSPWRHVPLFLAAAGVLAWLVMGRVRRIRPPATASSPPKAPQKPAIVTTRPRAPNEGYAGYVYDAHDGEPIAAARVRVLHTHFTHEVEVAAATTDLHGAFAFPATVGDGGGRPGANGLTLVAEGPLHTAFRQPLPAPGELMVFLVTRRRHVLARFMAWAQGRVHRGSAEPAPLAVAAATTSLSEREFALSVASFVYSADSATEAREKATLDLLPDSPHGDLARHQAVVDALDRRAP